jgi:hypothetical protein
MGQAYNVSAAVGRVSTYVTAVLTVILAILCTLMGTALISSGAPTGVVVDGKVTAITPGCNEGYGKACTVTVGYTLDGKEYTSAFPSMLMSYAVGDIIQVRIADQQVPEKAEENFPKRTVGWMMLCFAVVGVCITVTLYQFASDSSNFAAGAGLLTFLQALTGLF